MTKQSSTVRLKPDTATVRLKPDTSTVRLKGDTSTVRLKADRYGHDEDRRGRGVTSRDRMADGTFVFAVRSTGIYCRPSCPSRRPRRDRVEFFPAPSAAEAAGFRACR